MRPDLTLEALGVIAGLYGRTGRAGEIAGLKHRADAHEAEMSRAMEERSRPTLRDRFLPPVLTPAERKSLLAAIRRHPEVRGAWLAAKEMKHFP